MGINFFFNDCLESRGSQAQDTSWPLVEFVARSPWFNLSAALVNSQLVCLRPVGILNKAGVECSVLSQLRFIGPEKPLLGVVN